MTQGFIWGWFTKKQKPKILCYCLFKIISIFSTAKNMLKIAEVKRSSCGLQKKLQLRLRSNISLKVAACDCGGASFKLRNCDCGLKKKLRVPTSAYWCCPLNCSTTPIQFTTLILWAVVELNFLMQIKTRPFDWYHFGPLLVFAGQSL